MRVLNRFRFLIGLILTMSHVLGCSSFTPAVPLDTPLSSSAVEHLQPGLTIQVSPTLTEQPQSTSASTITPEPASTFTQPPALTRDQALEFVRNMQESNGGCELPCWWGITPGETTGQAAKQILSPLRDFTEFLTGYYNGKGEKDRLLLSEYSNFRVDLVLSNDERPVDEIAVYSFLSSSEPSHYDESWRRYFLNDLLTRLGVPTDVWLGFGLNRQKDPNNTGVEDTSHFYELYVIYSDLGVIVRYMGSATHGEFNRACPSLEQLQDLYLFIRKRSSGLLIGPPGEMFTDARPLPNISNLSIETFYENFNNGDSQACLESPSNLWP